MPLSLDIIVNTENNKSKDISDVKYNNYTEIINILIVLYIVFNEIRIR